MKHKPPPILIILLLLVVAIAAGYWYFSNNPDQWQQTLTDFGLDERDGAESGLTASGFIEADEVKVAAEMGGRIRAMLVDKGDPVVVGQELVFLDTALLDAQVDQIEAEVALAEAQLAQLEAGVPPEKIAVAEAAAALAEAERQAAFQAWQDAMLVRDTPQELNAQIDAVYAELKINELRIDQMALLRDAAELGEDITAQQWKITQEGLPFSVSIPVMVDGEVIKVKKSGVHRFPEGDKQRASVEWNLATMGVWKGWVEYENAVAAHESSQKELNALAAERNDPMLKELNVAQAKATYDGKAAAVTVAQTKVDELRAGAPASQIEALKAQRDQAVSQIASLRAQLEKFTLYSPIEGTVVEQVAHQGEVAMPGGTLLNVANLDRVTLTVYVSNAEYGRLRQNQAVEVYVDSYPDRAFEGIITRINDEAEFTPKNVQTHEERTSLVYAIKITLPNEDGLLKPGMPADAVFIEALPAGGF